ncbi:Winged helix DNA-binding domain-containing protein [Micromonospora siamensis]|uniref:Winged helix DNA-binding domain-containing protein n=1 Tax=Micromonospora siamensis TaxID=299152 RepID=A0A1C5I4W7_9ACTN|nr:transcriptional regulator [Micromonospora siamensis]SCG53253.1 Winged helix DNA-binding domain-containing protein [Micromonospora siamensis]
MTEARFDDTIHAPVRLRICGLLNNADRLDFAVVRDTLGVSDATLSKHVKTLVDAGHVTISKSASANRTDARRVTWLSLSPTGRSAFAAHIRALQDIAGSRT